MLRHTVAGRPNRQVLQCMCWRRLTNQIQGPMEDQTAHVLTLRVMQVGDIAHGSSLFEYVASHLVKRHIFPSLLSSAADATANVF